MRFLAIPLFLSFISYSWATENIEQPVESSSRDNFLVRLLQLDNQTTGPNIDLGKSTHLSANIIKEAASGHLMIAAVGGTNLTIKEKNKEISIPIFYEDENQIMTDKTLKSFKKFSKHYDKVIKI